MMTAKVHCVKSARIRRFPGPYFPAFPLNTGKYFAQRLYVQLRTMRRRAIKLMIVAVNLTYGQ